MLFPYFFAPLAIVLLVLYLWKLIKHFYEVATECSGIHYVTHKPTEIKMNTRFFNPFHFEVDLANASLSGVKCTLKCEGLCYVQAMWCVPIYELIECLNKDWFDLISSITSSETDKELRFPGLYSSQPIILANDLENVTEFKIPSDQFSLDAKLTGEVLNPRPVYPLVVFMVLHQSEREKKFPAPYVIASVHAIHLSDEALNKSTVITQFIKLSSGHVGQVKKVYRASADEGQDLCLVCYQQPASVVQISCCHFCLCRSCYEKCDKCPICRNTRMDFFELPPVFNS